MASHVMTLSESIVIRRPRAEVYALAEDLPAHAGKLSAIAEFERLAGEGAPGVGHRWRIVGETRLGRRSGTVEITALERPEKLAFQGEGRGFRADTSVSFDVVDDGRCRLTTSSEIYALTFAARLLAPGMRLWRRRAQKGMKKGLKHLKKRLEQSG